MEAVLVRRWGHEALDLSLTDEQAESVAVALAGLHVLAQKLDSVTLPFLAEPFWTPKLGDVWLETWTAEDRS